MAILNEFKKKRRTRALILTVLCLVAASRQIKFMKKRGKKETLEKRVMDYIIGDINTPSYIGKGKIDGCFTDDEFWRIYDKLHREYPQYVGKKISVGESWEKRQIHGFYLGFEPNNLRARKSKFWPKNPKIENLGFKIALISPLRG